MGACVCVCVCQCVIVAVFANVCMPTRAHIHTWVCASIFLQLCVYVHIRICANVFVGILHGVCVFKRAHTCTHSGAVGACTRVRKYACACVYTSRQATRGIWLLSRLLFPLLFPFFYFLLFPPPFPLLPFPPLPLLLHMFEAWVGAEVCQTR